MKNIDKQFVSEIDKKMAEFDATHAKSVSQQAEINKYQKINHLRDVSTTSDNTKDDLWD
ncbi:MAG: hypothetical protein COY58_07665 [Gammaproteobacteria bacterium CG_4_10_14_0_8_um_filter_38_16]|nr:MAG: hypothetical protein COY58_07665 [Gammaproteobacteria bacterium CG_4_10_14_0_8_um_filter_38_16]PJA03428.1 MAG: hypothetical protein COX72_04915 [Gammaproteobacteria bacterium CG_4_10_14_0_2_um_filter_38_22]PJB10583.1 MAG: hypothetical protein CO120_03805 [Gammaproteobacteria bacterium CG_4_9_14_3_um_filter_38_9]